MNITPRGKQTEVLALPAKGHIIVLGTAGSGKTTIALLRARHLANLQGNNQVLLVTFNKALVTYMKGMSNSTSSKLTVENYHTFARGYLDSKEKMPKWNGILNPEGKEYHINQAVNFFKEKYPNESTLKRSIDFFVDEITFIENFGFENLDEYYSAERIGRAAANIKRENRKWIFEVYKKYKELREIAGKLYDWDDIAYYAYKELQSDQTKRRYTHIIVDEGQDFSPMMIKSLIAAVADGGSFTFFGDVAQQIYGSRLSWRDSGLQTNKIWRFDMNYRNPNTITEFATEITHSKYWHKDRDMIDATAQIAEGPKPALLKFKNQIQEMKWIVEQAIYIGQTSSTVIICRNRADVDCFMSMFQRNHYKAIEIDKDMSEYLHTNQVYLTAFHSAKGLEFDNVFVPFLIDSKFPDPDGIAKSISKDEAYADEIKLLYVAVTRSKYGLYLSYSGNLSPLVPEASNNYDFYDMEETV